MHQKLLKSAHYIELGSYQYWPVLVPRGIRLYTYEQIPVSLKDNPYITDGYRAYLPSRLCIKSLFILSNETVNIWSHLLGFFLFFTLGIYDMTSVLPSASASREDFVICSICLFCFQAYSSCLHHLPQLMFLQRICINFSIDLRKQYIAKLKGLNNYNNFQ
ncbi:progestin and adipoQ receptor family member 3 isoform X6 [Nomascus leucogenys]|uniref:progestin and adipoQ receptor family member 3 isoform X6 n=1 Tax=Nomascus leucogenys TaxID=61853 RepID=UPI00122D8E80|nr:progestin and adipoQ receptor family member 3 isoform X6 [Nomascus leucogenys]